MACTRCAGAQDSHASCHEPPESGLPVNLPLLAKLVSAMGDSSALTTVKGVRYTAQVSSGAGPAENKTVVTLTHVYPDRFMLTTQGPGDSGTYIDASPDRAFVSSTGGTRTDLPETLRVELLKSVRLDVFYVTQNIGREKIKITDVGSDRVGDIEVEKLVLNVG